MKSLSSSRNVQNKVQCEHLKAEMAPDTAGIRVLCHTKWTVRAEELQSMFNNYEVLQNVWIDSLNAATNTEMKARIQGVASQMKTFDYFHGVSINQSISHTQLCLQCWRSLVVVFKS